MDKLEIKVNGMPVKLTEFPAKIITNTIIGMLSSLRDVDEIETVEIKLKKDTKN